MSDRKKHHWLSSWFLETEAQDIVPIRYWLLGFLLMGAGLFVAASRSPGMADQRARLDVNWSFDRGDYTYRLRGRYSFASLSDDFATSISNAAEPGSSRSSIDLPAGTYRVTLEPGYTLERIEMGAGAQARGVLGGGTVEVVPASLVSPNPVVITAQGGRIAPLGLSLVDMPGMAADPEATCMDGS
jgi:hypothetical protein